MTDTEFKPIAQYYRTTKKTVAFRFDDLRAVRCKDFISNNGKLGDEYKEITIHRLFIKVVNSRNEDAPRNKYLYYELEFEKKEERDAERDRPEGLR